MQAGIYKDVYKHYFEEYCSIKTCSSFFAPSIKYNKTPITTVTLFFGPFNEWGRYLTATGCLMSQSAVMLGICMSGEIADAKDADEVSVDPFYNLFDSYVAQ